MKIWPTRCSRVIDCMTAYGLQTAVVCVAAAGSAPEVSPAGRAPAAEEAMRATAPAPIATERRQRMRHCPTRVDGQHPDPSTSCSGLTRVGGLPWCCLEVVVAAQRYRGDGHEGWVM